MSVDYQAIKAAIQGRFETLVTDAEPIPTQFDNLEFAQPEDADWCRFKVQFGDTVQASAGEPGSNVFRTPGVAFAQVFRPFGKGDKPMYELAKRIGDNFRATSASGVTYRSPSVGPASRSGPWWVVTVTIPWYADSIA